MQDRFVGAVAVLLLSSSAGAQVGVINACEDIFIGLVHIPPNGVCIAGLETPIHRSHP